jgi:DNA modification methylase
MEQINLKNGVLLCNDAKEALVKLPAESIDFMLTSPPYDKQRIYKGYTFNFKEIAQQCTRVLKPGGVIVWVVNDATINGSESLSSFKQVIYFREKCKLRLHDTMMFAKNNPIPGDHGPRYRGAFEYMFAFSKGKPNTFNAITWGNKERTQFTERFRLEETGRRKLTNNGTLTEAAGRTHPNIFFYTVATRRHKKDEKHPAVFPDQLAEDQIRTWTNPGDVVLDPFIGSGTTAMAAIRLERRFIGIDISSEYLALAANNIRQAEDDIGPLLTDPEMAEKLLPIPLDFE